METAYGELVHQAGARPKILVVDDQSINIRLVGELFKGEFDIYMAMDGEQAMAQCDALLPDLVLLDLVMPGIDGYEVCRRLKASATTRHIPIIFISSQREEVDEALGFELGAVDYVTKPFNHTILQARVRTHLTLKFQADRLRSNAHFMRMVTDNIPGLIGYWNADLRCMFANAGYDVFFKKPHTQIVGLFMKDLLGHGLYAENETVINGALSGEPQQFERTVTRVDGSIAFVWTQYVPDIHNGKVLGFFVLVSDITDVKQAQLAQAASEQFARTTMDTVPEMICVLDQSGRIIEINQAWRDFFDAHLDDTPLGEYALGAPYLQVYESVMGIGGNNASLMAQGVAAVLAGEQTLFSLEYFFDSPTDRRFFFARVKRFLGDSGHVLVAHGDITERKLLELELARMAHTDVLTGLHNRRYFLQLSDTELSRTARHGGPLSMLMLDIDHFKLVNDTHGHQMGDLVIQRLAAVCQDQLRELDVIGRLGGEEFAITMPNADHTQAMMVAERLRLAIEATAVPLPLGANLRFTVSIGVTTLPNSLTTLDVLLDQADRALYKAKNGGRNQVCSFTAA